MDLLRRPARKPKAIMDGSLPVPTPVRNDTSNAHALEDKPGPATRQSVLPIPNGVTPPKTPVPPPASTEPAHGTCLEDFEQAAFGTLKKRKEGGNKGHGTMKKPAAASKKIAKPKVTAGKRGAADSSAKHGYPGKACEAFKP